MPESPLEQLERKLLEYPTALRFRTCPLICDGVRLEVVYWSPKHQQRVLQFFDLVGDDDVLDMLSVDAIESIVGHLNETANEALEQGPLHKVVVGVGA